MRLIRIVIFLGASLTCCLGLSAQAGENPTSQSISSVSSQASAAAPQYKNLDAYMNAVVPSFLASINSPGIGIAIGTALNHQVGKFYFGETSEGNGEPPDGSTLFLLASVSKTFTAALLALYAQQHLVNLDDPIQKYLPSGIVAPLYNSDASHPITLEHLATHTSGLPLMPTFSDYTGPASPQKLFGSLNQAQLGSQPGTKYLYSNFGYSLLGQILAQVGNKAWKQLLEQSITLPLSMTETKVFTELNAEELARKIPGKNIVTADWTFFPAENPAGGLYSTMDDMGKYLFSLMGEGNSSLSPLLPELFQARHPEGVNGKIGLSWNLGNLPVSGAPVVWKDGGLLGYESYLGFVPSQGVGVVLLINSQGVNLDGLGQEILNFLLTNPAQSVSPIQRQKTNPVQGPQIPVGPGPVEGLENGR